jgi:micrococcal nuclease
LDFALAVSAGPDATCKTPERPRTLSTTRVIRIVDGDTIQTVHEGRRQRVRLIGIDTPETHLSVKLNRDVQRFRSSARAIIELGRLSEDFTRRHLDQKTVQIELDAQKRDRYSRLLAYVWLSDGRLFNALILQEGFALTLTIPPNVKYSALFVACQRQAQVQDRGLWAVR